MKILRLFVCSFLLVTYSTVVAAESISPVSQDNGATPASPLPVEIAPNNPDLHYMGRFDMDNAAGTLCAWSGSAVGIRFHGTALNASLLLQSNRFEVVVDGVPTKVLTGTKDKILYNLASGLADSDHTVLLFKDTEAKLGTAGFNGFQLNEGGTILSYPIPDHRIEVIGDSISCGYGNEASDQTQHFSPSTENAYWSYGATTARAFNADYTCIAWSGKKLWPDNSLIPLYNLVLPAQPELLWKFDGPKPDVVLINLCTNDFRFNNPAEEEWVKTYRDFVGRVRNNYPNSTIYLALGPMLNDSPPDRKPLTTARNYIQRVVTECNSTGDLKVHFLEFDPQNRAINGLGADWHPSLKTHQIMAQKLIATLQNDLGWIPLNTPLKNPL